MMKQMAAETDALSTFIAAAFVALVVVGLVWVLRFQNRQFPKGVKHMGRQSRDRDALGWLVTKFTWLSGGRG
jgi:hypothetical protein